MVHVQCKSICTLYLLSTFTYVQLTCPLRMTNICLASVIGVCRLSSISGLGMRHFWYMSYCDIHMGLSRYTSGGTPSLQ